MQHAILIMCHKVTSALVYSLEEISNDPNTKAFIHVDAKSSLTDFAFIKKYKNCILLEQRDAVYWGDSSQMYCTLRAMGYIFKNFQFDYLSLMSGDDIFHRTLKKLNNYLSKNMGVDFIGVTSFNGVSDLEAHRFLYRYNHIFFERDKSFFNKVYRGTIKKLFKFGFLKNKLNKPFKVMYKGSNWFTITSFSVEYILNFCENNKSYLKYFEKSYCCDEIFFVSIIFNSPLYKSTSAYIQNNSDDNLMSLRKIDWNSGPEFPKVYYEEDIKNLSVDNTFIIRKIDSGLTVARIKEVVSELNKNE